MLPAGDLELVAESTAQNLEMPKGLSWTLTCNGAREPLAELVVEPGDYVRQSISGTFSVPAEGCATQRRQLQTGVIAPSMRYRYGGTLIVNRIAVRPPDAF